MRVVYFNTHDVQGGAARNALNLYLGMKKLGFDTWMAVGSRKSTHNQIVELPHNGKTGPSQLLSDAANWIKTKAEKLPGGLRWARWLDTLSNLQEITFEIQGRENYVRKQTQPWLQWASKKADVVHLHNLHGNYFDLESLTSLSKDRPTFLTLHDEWTLTGHCAFTMGCGRWQMGCGNCPDLSIYPHVYRDSTARNLDRKRRVWENSKLYVTAPSQWLLKRAEHSILAPAIVDARVVRLGIDLSVFKPTPKAQAKKELGLLETSLTFLSTAVQGEKNPFRDGQLIENTLNALTQLRSPGPLQWVVLGSPHPRVEERGIHRIVFVPYTSSVQELARFYSAADLFLHPTLADNFPYVLLEAMACGTPVLSTNIGGIHELIEAASEPVGALVPAKNFQIWWAQLKNLASNPEGLRRMSHAALEHVRAHYSLEREVRTYRNLYETATAFGRA